MNDSEMVRFVLYDPATGDIVSAGTTDRLAVEHQIAAGKPILMAAGDFTTDRVDLKTKTVQPKLKARKR